MTNTKRFRFTYKVEVHFGKPVYIDVIDTNNFSAFIQAVNLLNEEQKKQLVSVSKWNCHAI